mgnify:FL=1
MMFECKTFDEQNEEKNIRRFETKITVNPSKSQTSLFQKEPLKAVSI